MVLSYGGLDYQIIKFKIFVNILLNILYPTQCYESNMSHFLLRQYNLPLAIMQKHTQNTEPYTYYLESLMRKLDVKNIVHMNFMEQTFILSWQIFYVEGWKQLWLYNNNVIPIWTNLNNEIIN